MKKAIINVKIEIDINKSKVNDTMDIIHEEIRRLLKNSFGDKILTQTLRRF